MKPLNISETARLRNGIASGRAVLFTGAGFSMEARATSGLPVAGVARLKKDLSTLAYGTDSEADDNTLPDLYDIAFRKARNKLKEVLLQLFKCDSGSLPGTYKTYFSMPWARCYTLNIDDLDRAAARRWDLARDVKSINALAQGIDVDGDELYVIHLNGRVEDFPKLTFSPIDYAKRTAFPDTWMQQAAIDMVTRPVVYIGTTLDEPPLWHFLQLREARDKYQRELRPPSFLVTPTLSRARRDRLRDQNIHHVPMTTAEFAVEVLDTLSDARVEGFQKLSIRASRARIKHAGLQAVSQVRDLPGTDASEYLLGREPEWADVIDGYAIEREFDRELFVLATTNHRPLILVTGTAGSGKTTSLMRLALKMENAGRRTYWVESERRLPGHRLRQAVKKEEAKVLLIDDVDYIGDDALETVLEVIHDAPDLKVIASLRSSKAFRLESRTGVRKDDAPYVEAQVPHLRDSDIDALIESLTRANRLGKLLNRSLDEQRRLFVQKERADRQLLVALREITLGEDFDKRVESECQDLDGANGVLYGMLAIATRERMGLTRDELLLGSGGASLNIVQRIDSLIARGMIVEYDEDLLRIRHRAIADVSTEYLRKAGLLSEPLKAVCWAMAQKVSASTPATARTFRLLARLLNHDFMISLTSDRDVPRRAYEHIEPLLGPWAHQYWLQRGRFETETGRLDTAQNFLESARQLRPNDWLVDISMADLIFAKAILAKGGMQGREWAVSATQDLEDLIVRKGGDSAYPYHVLGRRGLEWVTCGALTREERRDFLNRLASLIEQGQDRHPLNWHLKNLQPKLERERLMTAVTVEGS